MFILLSFLVFEGCRNSASLEQKQNQQSQERNVNGNDKQKDSSANSNLSNTSKTTNSSSVPSSTPSSNTNSTAEETQTCDASQPPDEKSKQETNKNDSATSTELEEESYDAADGGNSKEKKQLTIPEKAVFRFNVNFDKPSTGAHWDDMSELLKLTIAVTMPHGSLVYFVKTNSPPDPFILLFTQDGKITRSGRTFLNRHEFKIDIDSLSDKLPIALMVLDEDKFDPPDLVGVLILTSDGTITQTQANVFRSAVEATIKQAHIRDYSWDDVEILKAEDCLSDSCRVGNGGFLKITASPIKR